VSGLSQEGKVICVRLALFAEMMKGRAWTPATLRKVGGTEGVGITFLEDTFSSPSANPKHRLHQQAARSVLKALLPESGTDIKGHMRSQQELLEASGYVGRPRDFDQLLRILDGELRLITPTDPEGTEDDSSTTRPAAGGKYYQLTHDYLVHSLRDWLTRKQKETRRGRTELLLADRASVWKARPENRQLPSLWEWLRIRWLTRKKNWTPPQRKMMRRATRYHVIRGFVLAACLILLGFVSWEGFARLKAHTLRDRLLECTTADVPGIVKEMAPYRRWLNRLLQEAFAQAQENQDARKQLHTSLALLPVDSGQMEFLYERLLTSEPQEVVVIREALLNHKPDLRGRWWRLLENPKNDQDQRFRAACALAAFSPDDLRWEKASVDVAEMLVIQKPFVIAQWTDALKGVKKWLIPPLADLLVDEKRSVAERGLIAGAYGTYAADMPDAYIRLEKELDEIGVPNPLTDAKIALAKKQANVGVALLVMGRGEKVWPLFEHRPDPTLRSYLIDRVGPGGVDGKVLISRLDQEKEVSARRAILLGLGGYSPDRLAQDQRQNFLPRLLELYRDDPDPGIHGAAEWLLRQLQMAGELRTIDKELGTGKVQGKRQWYVNGQGQTMVVIVHAGSFWMGEEPHWQRIGRSFAIASKEVTVEEFLRFRKDHKFFKESAPKTDCPINNVSWYDAAAYCNWLSEQEGIPKDQWCYEPNKDGKFAEGMRMAPNYLQRTGYRLPTEAEWEFACRAGSETELSFGEADDLLAKYAWYIGNSPKRSQSVGTLRPNEYGVFDMHGNAWEWTQSLLKGLVRFGRGEGRSDDTEDGADIKNTDSRVLHGGSFDDHAVHVRSAYRISYEPSDGYIRVGFRPARTFTP
jgi:formylglycine-generating enzyme required for sulfatase activity